MIIYNTDGLEVDYGRTKRVYLYNKPEDALPSWLSVTGTLSVTSIDNFIIEKGSLADAFLDSRLFLIQNITALRFSVNNFRKSTNNSYLAMQLVSEDSNTILEYKTKSASGTGVGLYLNGELVSDVLKFNFNGELVNKPRKLGFHYCPNTGYVALLENDRVVHGYRLAEKLDASKKYKFRIFFTTTSITFSEVEIINWVSY